MNMAGHEILEHLSTVEGLRRQRNADPQLQERVLSLKTYQSQRFARSYADLLQQPRYAPATRFFLEELYGPQEFGARDSQFARVVPTLVRMFPEDIVGTVAGLAALHALSETLDFDMAMRLASPVVNARAYVEAWQAVGRRADRLQQIQWTLKIGWALDRYTKNSVLRASLRVMRRPAQAAGLGDLQRFLETGFDTFGAMRGARDFLETVERRERALADALFDPAALSKIESPSNQAERADASPLGQLP